MEVYRTDRIRNVALLGHGGAGKTTLTEAMAYLSGITNRMGRVEDGNTVSDYDKEENKRGFSISTTLVPIEWNKTKINILDTPGFFDFVGEAEEAVTAADAAVIVVSGKAGVQVGTQKAWELCERYDLPRIVYVTAQSCPTLCDPMDCSLPGSSVHGIFQARVLEWGAIALCFNNNFNFYYFLQSLHLM